MLNLMLFIDNLTVNSNIIFRFFFSEYVCFKLKVICAVQNKHNINKCLKTISIYIF